MATSHRSTSQFWNRSHSDQPRFFTDFCRGKRRRRSGSEVTALNGNFSRSFNKLLERHAVVFGEDRGHLRHTKDHLHLVEGATPRFCKARPLPYALRDKVATELDRLEHDGILTKVSWSEWATPVVSVPKKDGSVRICGDFKVSLNKQLRVDQYLLPR